MLNLQLVHGDEFKYLKKELLFRGVNKDFITIDDYKPNAVHYWPTLTSTSKSLNIARQFSGFIKHQKCVLFKIYLN